MTRTEREDDGKRGIFTLFEDDKLAGELTYTWIENKAFIIDHTGVNEVYGGKGHGKTLVMKAVKFAREKGLKIFPLCSFAKKVFDKDKSLNDVRF